METNLNGTLGGPKKHDIGSCGGQMVRQRLGATERKRGKGEEEKEKKDFRAKIVKSRRLKNPSGFCRDLNPKLMKQSVFHLRFPTKK